MTKINYMVPDQDDSIIRTTEILLEEIGATGFFSSNGLMSFWLDTYTISNEPKCFTGEVFPFDVPQCHFHECGDSGSD